MQALVFGLLMLAGSPNTPPSTPVSPADTWPQWRGPTGDSVSPSSKLPVHWSETENVVWKTPIPGKGNSTPAIWKDAIFVTAHDGDRLLLLRVDRATGKIVWQREVGKGMPRLTGGPGPNRFHDENTMASPSPVTDGLHVWAYFGNGDLACYDFAGTRVWAINLQEKYGLFTIWWGHANSPCLVDDVLISVCMQDPKGGGKSEVEGGGKSFVVAHDKRTGKERWSTPRMIGVSSEPADAYTTPVVYRHDGRTEVIVYGGLLMDAYDPATGKQLWQCRAFKGNRNISGPTLAGDTVFAVEGMRGAAIAVRAGGSGDVTTSNVEWRYAGATPDAASPTVANGFVFLATNDGFGVCLDRSTGKEVWKKRLASAFRATPLAVGDKVYFFGKEGKTAVVNAAREFKVVAESDLDENTVASPAVAGENLFLRTKQHLWCIGNPKRAAH